MTGRLEIMKFALKYVRDIKGQIASLSADPEKRGKMAHAIALVQRALGDGESFDPQAVRPDNCYIICVAVI